MQVVLKKTWQISLSILLVIGFFYLVYLVLPYFVPFLLALIIAIMIEPMVHFFQRLKLNRSLAVIITYILTLSITISIIYFIFTKIIDQIFNLIKLIQANFDVILSFFFSWFNKVSEFYQSIPENWSNTLQNQLANMESFFQNLARIIGGQTLNIAYKIPSIFIDIVIIIIAAFLLSLSLPKIKERFFSFFKPDSQKKLEIVLTDLKKATVGIIQGQLIMSTIIYVLVYLGLAILKIDFAYAIAFIIVIVDILPILGTGTVIIPWSIYNFIQGNNYLAFGLIILYVLLVVVRRIIEPKIVGEQIGLSALNTLISLYVGFKLLGIIGLFVMPLIFILLQSLIKTKLIKLNFRL